MISIKKILVPTDFSEHSHKAILYGRELASQFGAELHLLHVFEPVPIAYSEGAVFTPDTEAQLLEEGKKALDDLEVAGAEGLTIYRDIRSGHPIVEIIRYARETDTDLIVVGTHGRGAIAHMLLGSVAEKVVRKAPCPVLAVRDEEHEFIMP